jgi:hypothetical protein
MPVARSRSGLSTRLSERQRKQLYGDTDTPAQSAGRKGKQALQERLRQLRSQGPMVLLELINVAPATLLKPWQHTDLMVRVRDVWPEAPTPELTLLAGGIDHELEELAGHLRLSIYGLATMPRSFCQGTERLVMVARNVVDGEERSLLEAAKCGGPLEGLRTTLRQAGEHTRRPARIFAQAILKALEHAPAAWQARVRRCAYLPCPRPFFWDATDNARRRYCSKCRSQDPI